MSKAMAENHVAKTARSRLVFVPQVWLAITDNFKPVKMVAAFFQANHALDPSPRYTQQTIHPMTHDAHTAMSLCIVLILPFFGGK